MIGVRMGVEDPGVGSTGRLSGRVLKHPHPDPSGRLSQSGSPSSAGGLTSGSWSRGGSTVPWESPPLDQLPDVYWSPPDSSRTEALLASEVLWATNADWNEPQAYLHLQMFAVQSALVALTKSAKPSEYCKRSVCTLATLVYTYNILTWLS